MLKQNISKKILYWYDNNKRVLPWRIHVSKKQKQYFTLVSEFMLQQTQVKTVIPYFESFIKKIPNLESLAKVNSFKLMKCWEGLGYYSRAKNLKKTAIKTISDFNGKLPNTIEELKSLPGIGDYTSRAIMAIVYNKQIIPLDGNIERLLKRTLYLKTEKEISKNNLKNKKIFFGLSKRSSDYVQALMELGALICRPSKPLCYQCPISKNCISYQKKDFEIYKKKKFNKTKYFEANIFKDREKFFLVKNKKFNFLKNLLIFPMKEVEMEKFNSSLNKKINIKISNIDMRIIINTKCDKLNFKQGFFFNNKDIKKQILPSFTKKIYHSVVRN